MSGEGAVESLVRRLGMAGTPPRLSSPAVWSLDETPVEYEDGLPVAWRVLAYGPFTVWQRGLEQHGVLTEAHVDAMLAYYAGKGSRVPIDSKHVLYKLAAKHGVEEAELLTALGTDKLAAGFGVPAKRADGLWIEDLQWTDIGAAVMREGAFRYFSPVIRGAYSEGGDLRFSSLALTNEPAINQLPALAAADDDDDLAWLAVSHAQVKRALAPQKEEAGMKNLLKKLGAALAVDVAVLSDDGEPSEELVAAVEALPARLQAAAAAESAVAQLREALVADAETPLPALIGTAKALAAKAEQTDELTKKVDALVADAEAGKLKALITKGRKTGQLTPIEAQEWHDNPELGGVAVLEAYLKIAPVKCPPDGADPELQTKRPDADAAVLSEDDRQWYLRHGLSPDEVDKIAKHKAGSAA